MKFIIVVNAYIKNKSQKNQAARIAEELRNLGAECEVVKNIDLAEIISGKTSAVKADACVFLDKDRAAARLLEKSGLRLFNCAEAIEVCDDKMLTHIALADNGIKMPDTVYAPLCYYADAVIDETFLKTVSDKLGFPLVAKKCYGSLGSGVYLINNAEQLKSFENDNKLTAHFYQQFISKGGDDTNFKGDIARIKSEDTCVTGSAACVKGGGILVTGETRVTGSDIRVIVIGGKYVCAMKRINENDFRSNVELGGHGENYEADANLIALCEKTARILKLDYCGIDVLTDQNGNRYVCEVNSNAFFAEAERVCGVNIAKKFAGFIIEQVKIA